MMCRFLDYCCNQEEHTEDRDIPGSIEMSAVCYLYPAD